MKQKYKKTHCQVILITTITKLIITRVTPIITRIIIRLSVKQFFKKNMSRMVPSSNNGENIKPNILRVFISIDFKAY